MQDLHFFGVGDVIIIISTLPNETSRTPTRKTEKHEGGGGHVYVSRPLRQTDELYPLSKKKNRVNLEREKSASFLPFLLLSFFFAKMMSLVSQPETEKSLTLSPPPPPPLLLPEPLPLPPLSSPPFDPFPSSSPLLTEGPPQMGYPIYTDFKQGQLEEDFLSLPPFHVQSLADNSGLAIFIFYVCPNTKERFPQPNKNVVKRKQVFPTQVSFLTF